jgi:hypothetical protein
LHFSLPIFGALRKSEEWRYPFRNSVRLSLEWVLYKLFSQALLSQALLPPYFDEVKMGRGAGVGQNKVKKEEVQGRA